MLWYNDNIENLCGRQVSAFVLPPDQTHMERNQVTVRGMKKLLALLALLLAASMLWLTACDGEGEGKDTTEAEETTEEETTEAAPDQTAENAA